MSLLALLSEQFGAAFAAQGLDPDLGEVVVSNRPDLAQFQCNGALPAAKQAGRNPREMAEAIVDSIDGAGFADLSIAGPGFLNITLTDDALAGHLARIAGDARLDIPSRGPEQIVIDFGGYNVAKATHVGHMRPTIIGDSLQRIARFLGHQVTSDIHLGDWGLQMGMLIEGVREQDPDLPYFNDAWIGEYPSESPVTLADLQVLYPQVSARTKSDPELAEAARKATLELQGGRRGYRALWQHFVDVTLASQRQDVADLDVHFDLWYGESTVAEDLDPLIRSLLESGVAGKSDGAIVIDVAEPDDKAEIPPLLLAKSDGAALYTTTDLATLQMRIDVFGAREVLYVVDSRQSLHFEQVFRAARKAGIAPPEVVLEHVDHGTINGPDGSPLKTRDGGVPPLHGLIDDAKAAAAKRVDEARIGLDLSEDERADVATKVAAAALKFGDLINHRTSNYVFDLDRFTSFEGKTGPYLQYATVRITSILRKADEAGLAPGAPIAPSEDAERALILRLATIPETVLRAWDLRAPNHIAESAFDLAGAFNRFYEACHILREEDPRRQASWLQLAATTQRALTLMLDLLGISVPQRM